MEESVILGSLDRIEAALTRIEAAARNRAAPTDAPVVVEADQHAREQQQELERRHAALKASVGHALARLDSLIGEQA